MTEVTVLSKEGLELHHDRQMAHRLPVPGSQIIVPHVGVRRVREVHGDTKTYRVVVE